MVVKILGSLCKNCKLNLHSMGYGHFKKKTGHSKYSCIIKKPNISKTILDYDIQIKTPNESQEICGYTDDEKYVLSVT